VNITEVLSTIIQRTMLTHGTVEDTEETLLDIREAARTALLHSDVAVVLEGDTICYACGFEFEDQYAPPPLCPCCKRPVIYLEDKRG
jgi:predicted Zn-ribbon and HTH transcriptional regulator